MSDPAPNWGDFLKGTLFPYGKRADEPRKGEELYQYGAFGDKNMLPGIAAGALDQPPGAIPNPQADINKIEQQNQHKTLGDLFDWLLGGHQMDQQTETAAAVAPPAAPEQPSGDQSISERIKGILGDTGGQSAAGPAYKLPDWATSGEPSPSEGRIKAPEKTASRSALEKRIEQLAQQSELPQETFKERLVRVLFGVAAGYSAALGAHPEQGAAGAIGPALTGGAGEAIRYGNEVQDERFKTIDQNRRALAEAAGLESRLVSIDSADQRSMANQKYLARQTDLQLESIKARMAAAQARVAAGGGDKIKQARELMGLILDMKKVEDARTASKFDDVKIDTPSGSFKVGDLQGKQKEAAIKSLQTSFTDPGTYNYYRQKVEEANKDKIAEWLNLGLKPEEELDKLTRSALMLKYMQEGQ